MYKSIIFVCILVISNTTFCIVACPNNEYNWKQPADTSTCTIWGKYNVKTFDDHGLNFQSRCTFTAVSFKVDMTEFKINVGLNPICKDKPQCHTVTQILYEGKTYKLQLDGQQIPSFTSGADSYPIPTELDGLRIHQPVTMLLIEFTNIGVVLKWNEKNIVEITIDNKRAYKLYGLCGNNDKCSSNEQILASGAQAYNDKQFLEEWQVDKQSCPESIDTSPTCRTKIHVDQATKACDMLRGNRFQDAHKVLNPDLYIKACTWNYCSCKLRETQDCLCDSFDSYVKASINAGGRGISWRDTKVCPFKCTGSLRYFPCAPKGGLQTCTATTTVAAPGKCEEGCFCAPNTFVHDGKCYLKKNCPCVFNGQTYKPGDTYQQKCHTCTCTNGKFVCPTVPPCFVTATVFGDPHYVTWDGKRYDFMGKCDYYLVKGNDFSIEADHQVYRGGAFVKDVNAGGVSYTRGVTIRMDEDVVHLKPDLVVIANNVTVNRFPYKAGVMIVTKPHGRHILVELPNWIQVQWDGYSTATIRLPTDLEGQVSGLMGTYTEDTSDDFMTPLGDIITDPVAFGNSWKTEFSCSDEPDQGVEHPCNVNPGGKPIAQKICGIIKTDIFKQCETDLETIYENCLYDTCYCKENPAQCACDVITIAAEGCGAKGIATNWRNNVPECRLPCPAGLVYQECGDACAGSCEDLSIRPACTKTCIEGCSCPPGLTFDENGKCIPIAQCKCRQDGNVYQPGFKYLKSETELITCRDGRLITSEPTDEDLDTVPDITYLNDKCDPENFSVYTPCRYPNPKTCHNMHIFEITSIAVCQEGCQCKEGYVFDSDNKNCVRPEECPCFERGQSYSERGVIVREGCNRCVCTNRKWQCKQEECSKLCIENEIKMVDCNTCRCKDAFWECTKHDCSQQCPVEGQSKKVDCNTCVCKGGFWACTTMECVHECKPQDVKVEGCKTCTCQNDVWVCNEDNCIPTSCPSEGEAKVFKFGKCVCKGGKWKCVKTQCDLWGDSHIKTFDGGRFDFQGECAYTLVDGKIGTDRFTVTFANGRCSHAGATCLKLFTIESDIRGARERVIFVKKGKLPSPESVKNLIITDHDLFVTIKSVDGGFEVFWDKNNWLYVKVEDRWQNNVMGLCGNYNRVLEDDVKVNNVKGQGNLLLAFVDGWRTNFECEKAKQNSNTCDAIRRTWAESQCKILLSQTFAPCHSKVPVTSYYEACVTDSCKCDLGGDCECLCSAISIYAQQCNNYGIPIQWRSQELCPLQCSKNTIYQPCAGTCPEKTCETIRRNLTLDCEEELCVEGCAPKPLPEGNVYTDSSYEKDVDEMACTQPRCKDIFYEGEVMYKEKCTVCICYSGQENCVKLPCPDSKVIDETTTQLTGGGTTPRPIITTKPVFPVGTTPPPIDRVTTPRGATDQGTQTVTTANPWGGSTPVTTANPWGGSTPVTTANPWGGSTPGTEITPPNPGESTTITTVTVPGVRWPVTTTARPTQEPICDKTKCPPLDCPDRIAIESEVKGYCCKSCQHESKCFVKMRSTNKFVLKKPGKVWMDGPCRECTCVGEEKYSHCSQCRNKICAKVNLRNTTIGNTYYEFTRGPCCPTMEPAACFHQNKIYRVGELWELNACASMKCVKDPATNLTFIQKLTEMCNEKCPIGFVYKASQNRCCGNCVQESCIFGDIAKAAGQTWTSPDGCTNYICSSVNGQYQVLSRETICPAVHDCPGRIRKGRCCSYCDTSELFVWETEPSDCDVEGIPPAA